MPGDKTKEQIRSVLECRDFLVSGEKFQLLPVAEGVLKTSPVPKNLSSYYESEDYISHTDAGKSITARIYQIIKKYMIRKKIGWIEELHEKGRILDIGAGTGDFLLSARKRGWQVRGVEPNKFARDLSVLKGVNLHNDLSAFEKEKFDVITLWHVLEHIPDLKEQIFHFQNLLKRDGILVIAVPNFKSEDSRFYKEFWAAYDVPRHVWHFTQKGIKKIFSEFGFSCTKIRPLPFDAFYVSMLSEKNKTGSVNFLRALYRGVRSNLAAKRTSEYSSLVYFFKKS